MRQAKLTLIREQVATGVLVIRQMTPVERAAWAKQRAVLEAGYTREERARCNKALNERRRRTALIARSPDH